MQKEKTGTGTADSPVGDGGLIEIGFVSERVWVMRNRRKRNRVGEEDNIHINHRENIRPQSHLTTLRTRTSLCPKDKSQFNLVEP